MFHTRSLNANAMPEVTDRAVVVRKPVSSDKSDHLAGAVLSTEDQIDILDGAAFLAAGGGGAKSLGHELIKLV